MLYVGQAKRFVPQGRERAHGETTPNLVEKDLKQFTNKTVRNFRKYLSYAVISTAYAFGLNQRIKMLHLKEVFEKDLDFWSEPPGLPWRAHGYKTKEDIRRDPEAVRQVRHFWHRIKHKEELNASDCLAYVRVHTADDGEVEIKSAWNYPATITFGEAIFAVPLTLAFRADDNSIAYEYETTFEGMRRLSNRFCSYAHFARFNFKKFDKTAPAWLIEMAFAILELNVDFAYYEGHGVADARQMIHMWEYLQSYFINTTIRMANGVRFRKKSGIANNSLFESLISTIINYLLCQWMCLEQTGNIASDIHVQGGDSLIATSVPLNLNECNRLMAKVGMELNMEGAQTSSDLGSMKFLGCTLEKPAACFTPQNARNPQKTISEMYFSIWGKHLDF